MTTVCTISVFILRPVHLGAVAGFAEVTCKRFDLKKTQEREELSNTVLDGSA
jgi:hypothetical protein